MNAKDFCRAKNAEKSVLDNNILVFGETDMKINFLGDSITYGAGASKPEQNYVNQVGAMLHAEVRNYGVGGTRFARQSKLSESAIYDYDFQMRMGLMATMDGDADFVFVFGGTNDYGHGDAEIGEKSDDNPYTFYGALNNVISFLIKKYGKEKICFLLPMPRYRQESPFGDKKQKLGLPLAEYVQIIKERLTFYGIEWIDLFKGFMPVPQTNLGDEYTVDGLHPNDLGHQMIAERICDYLKSKM